MLSSAGGAALLRPAAGTAPALVPQVALRHKPFAGAHVGWHAPRLLASNCKTAAPCNSCKGLVLQQQLHTCGLTPLGGGGAGGPPSEFHVNFGRAVRTLRQDIPRFFTQAPTTSVLAEDNFVFVDRIGRVHLGGGTTVVCGVDAYRRHLFMLRVYCGLIFSRSTVEVLRMWQRDTRTLAVRWTLRCAPRLAPGQPHKVLSLDGVSEYKFDSRGFIREHSVDLIDWDDGKLAKSKSALASPGVAMPAAFHGAVES